VPTLPIFRIEETPIRNTRREGMIYGKVDGSGFAKVPVMIARW
jgi:hypothetical protein